MSSHLPLEHLALHATLLTLGQANNKDIGHTGNPFLQAGVGEYAT